MWRTREKTEREGERESSINRSQKKVGSDGSLFALGGGGFNFGNTGGGFGNTGGGGGFNFGEVCLVLLFLFLCSFLSLSL